MASKRGPQPPGAGGRAERLDEIVSRARRAQDERLAGYREQSLRIHPWVCGRCGREFKRENLHLLTVHHKDHNHDNNPPDGSNWENLCIYCHDNEHSRYQDHQAGGGATDAGSKPGATNKSLAGLKDLLKPK